MCDFTGSGVAIVTPFKEDLSIDFENFEKLINFQVENGTDAIIVCGTTGEASTLSHEEHLEVVKFCVEKVAKRVPVIAGTGKNSTKDTIELSKECENLGVDGLLIVTPYYNKATQKGLINHYTKIAESTELPIILYNVPSRTSLNMEPKTVFELSKVKNIIGVKEASGDISQVAEIAGLCDKDFAIYSGNDDQILPVMSLGAKGVISVMANIIPKDTHDIVQAFLDGNVDESRKLQLKVIPLTKALFCELNPIPIKMAVELIGYGSSYLREPLTNIEDDNLKKLKSAMKDYSILG